MEKSGKEILDIEDINTEYQKLKERQSYLNKRFYAISLDYKSYIEPSWDDQEIYDIRDNILYRIFSALLHSNILLNYFTIIENRFEDIRKKDLIRLLNPTFPKDSLIETATQEISSIFESIIYHLVSSYDYFSTMINFMYGEKKDKQNTLKWNGLVNIARDKTSNLGVRIFSQKIVEINSQFVDKLYNYRSFLIHEKPDLNYFSLKFNAFNETSKIDLKFYITKKFTNKFHELKVRSKEKKITLKYVVFWLLNKSITSLNEILFELKKDMGSNGLDYYGMMMYQDKQTGAILPQSFPYWFENEWLKNKK